VSKARMLIKAGSIGAAIFGLIGLADRGWDGGVLISTFWGGVIGLTVGAVRVYLAARPDSST
jgi:hypothetical protein